MSISIVTANERYSPDYTVNNNPVPREQRVELGGATSNMLRTDLNTAPPVLHQVLGEVQMGNGASSMESKSCCTRFKDFFKQLWGRVKENVTKAMSWANTTLSFSKLSGVARFFAGLGTALGGVVMALVGLALCSVYYGVAIVAAVAAGLVFVGGALLAGCGNSGSVFGLAVVAALGVGGAILASPVACFAGGVVAVGAGFRNMVDAVRGTQETSSRQNVAGAAA